MTETLVNSPDIPAKTYQINRNNARELQRKGVLARKAKELAIQQENERLKKLADIGLRALEPHDVATTDDFRGSVLSRVRVEIQSTLDKLKDEDEPKARESLSRSLGVLLEHEGHLSGRPKSGVMKPTTAKPKRQQSFAEPEPAPESAPIIGPENG